MDAVLGIQVSAATGELVGLPGRAAALQKAFCCLALPGRLKVEERMCDLVIKIRSWNSGSWCSALSLGDTGKSLNFYPWLSHPFTRG